MQHGDILLVRQIEVVVKLLVRQIEVVVKLLVRQIEVVVKLLGKQHSVLFYSHFFVSYVSVHLLVNISFAPSLFSPPTLLTSHIGKHS